MNLLAARIATILPQRKTEAPTLPPAKGRFFQYSNQLTPDIDGSGFPCHIVVSMLKAVG